MSAGKITIQNQGEGSVVCNLGMLNGKRSNSGISNEDGARMQNENGKRVFGTWLYVTAGGCISILGLLLILLILFKRRKKEEEVPAAVASDEEISSESNTEV